MPCPSCSHTLQGIGYGMYHCPRCGTLTNCPIDGAVSVPALVQRCRDFAPALTTYQVETWNRLGIAESINTPAERVK